MNVLQEFARFCSMVDMARVVNTGKKAQQWSLDMFHHLLSVHSEQVSTCHPEFVLHHSCFIWEWFLRSSLEY